MKSVKKLNGSDLLEILILAKDLIYKHKEDINQLNVFPVPDGDTGTNMYLTLESALKNIDELKQKNINVNWIAETETIQVAKAMVEKGSGYSIIDSFSAEIYREEISIHEIEPKIGYKICMVSNKEKPLSVSAKLFISFLSDPSSKI